MPYPVSTFRALSSAFQYDASSALVERLAADFVSEIAADAHPRCVGLVKRDAVAKLYGLVFLLDGYGVTLRQRHRRNNDAVFVYAERAREHPAEHQDAVVLERRQLPAYSYPQAA